MLEGDTDGSEDLVITMTKRDDVLSELADGPKRKSEMASSMNVSRSTVHRSLEQLQELGLVTETREGFKLTGYGRTAFDAHQEFLSRASRFQESRELLRSIPEEYAFPSVVFEDVDVVKPAPFAMDQPARRLREVLSAANEVDWWAPTLTRGLIDVLADRVGTGALSGRVVFTETVVRGMRDERPGTLASLSDVAAMTVEQTASSLPFGLLVVEGDEPTLCVVVNDEAAVRGLLTTEREEAISWARDHLSGLDTESVRGC